MRLGTGRAVLSNDSNGRRKKRALSEPKLIERVALSPNASNPPSFFVLIYDRHLQSLSCECKYSNSRFGDSILWRLCVFCFLWYNRFFNIAIYMYLGLFRNSYVKISCGDVSGNYIQPMRGGRSKLRRTVAIAGNQVCWVGTADKQSQVPI